MWNEKSQSRWGVQSAKHLGVLHPTFCSGWEAPGPLAKEHWTDLEQDAAAQLARTKCFHFNLSSPKRNGELSVNCGWIICVEKEPFLNIVSCEQLDLETKFAAFPWLTKRPWCCKTLWLAELWNCSACLLISHNCRALCITVEYHRICLLWCKAPPMGMGRLREFQVLLKYINKPW